MNCSVKIPTPLRRHTNGAATVRADGAHVAEILQNLHAQHPGLKERLFENDGQLRAHLNVFVNSEDIRFLSGLETPLKEGDVVTLLPALAGG